MRFASWSGKAFPRVGTQPQRDEIRSRVLRNIFAAPTSLVPMAAGASALMSSWVVGGNVYLAAAGIAGLAGGVGLMAYRWAFGVEHLTERAFDAIAAEQRRDRKASLDRLERQLRGDRDPRTQTYLRRLRKLYNDFQDDLNDGKVSRSARTVLLDVDNLFRAAVQRLEDSYDLWDTAMQMSGDGKLAMMESRNRVIDEVHESVDHLSKIIEQFHSFRLKEDEGELSKLRRELDQTMQAARRAEERVEAIGKTINYNHSEFE